MSLLGRVDIMDPFFCPPLSFVAETSVFAPGAFTFPPFLDEPEDICLALDLLSPNPTRFDLLDSFEDLVQIERTPCFSSYRKVLQRVRPESYYLQSLCDRVSALESRFDRQVNARGAASDRKYTWTTEIEGKEADRKYKWTAEINAGKKEKEKEKEKHHHLLHHHGGAKSYKWTAEINAGKKEKEKEKHHHLHHHLLHHHGGARSYKWTAEIKEKGEEGYTRTYTWRSSTGGGDDGEAKSHKDKKEKKKEKKKEDKFATRVVEIEEPSGHGAVALRQVRRVIFKLSLQLLTITQI